MGAGASSQYRAGDANHRPPSFAEAVATKRRTTPNINVVVDGMNVTLANVPDYEKDLRCGASAPWRAAALRRFLIEADGPPRSRAAGLGRRPPRDGALQRSKLLFATPGGADDRFLLRHAEAHAPLSSRPIGFWTTPGTGAARTVVGLSGVSFMFDLSSRRPGRRRAHPSRGRRPRAGLGGGPGCEDGDSSRRSSVIDPAAGRTAGAVAALARLFAAPPASAAGRAPVRGRVRLAGRAPVRSFERLAAINDAMAARVEAAADIVLGRGPALDDTTECLPPRPPSARHREAGRHDQGHRAGLRCR